MVLINGGTASTAEFLAAALRDNDAAQLVGEHSFGKVWLSMQADAGYCCNEVGAAGSMGTPPC